mgnify:CR=1 FL=1
MSPEAMLPKPFWLQSGLRVQFHPCRTIYISRSPFLKESNSIIFDTNGNSLLFLTFIALYFWMFFSKLSTNIEESLGLISHLYNFGLGIGI